MLSNVLRTTAAVAALTGIIVCGVQPAAAQTPAKAQPKTVVTSPQITPDQMAQALAMQGANSNENAERTRDQFTELLRRFSPSVGRVFKLDPSLLSNPDYMATYPAITAFLMQHPEITRNPSYYFEQIRFSYDYNEAPRSATVEIWRNMMDWMGGLAVATIIVGGISWLVRSLIDYRRWIRLSKVQADAHTKLVDRLTANDELLAYVQSSAGAKFLESAPIALDPGSKRLGAPVSRILWSAQIGLVLMAGGLGLRYISTVVTDTDAVQPFMAMGILGMAVGVGFILSAGVSYVMSRHLGLFEKTARSEN